jgi:acyl carrier protein
VSDVLNTLRDFISRYAKATPSEIAADTRFETLSGWGSLARLQLLTTTEKHYAIRLDMQQYLRHETVGDLIRQVTGALS